MTTQTSTFSRRHTRALLAAALLVPLLVAAPGAQRRNRNNNALFGAPVATTTIRHDPGAYVGRLVTVSAGVETVLTDRSFVVDQRKMDGPKATVPAGSPMLVIAPYLAGSLADAHYLLMRGEVLLLDAGALGRLAADYDITLDAGVHQAYMGQPVLVATSVLDGTYAELAPMPIPPPTAGEVALDEAMKVIGPAVTAMRTGVERSDGEAVALSARTLDAEWVRVEETLDAMGQGPAAQWAREARTHSLAAAQAAAAGSWDGARQSTTSLGTLCQSCHAAYRDRLEDGTFRTRPGTF